MTWKPKLVVLDRDGVLNRDSPEYIKSPQEWHAIAGSLEAIAALNRAGYKVVVATNQSGIARGYFDMDTLNAIHIKMLADINALGGHLDGIFVCPHSPDENCDCRKPKPGLLVKIAAEFGISSAEMLVIGDSMRDILAAQAFGAVAFLVKTGNGLDTIARVPKENLAGVPIYDDLAEAVRELLG